MFVVNDYDGDVEITISGVVSGETLKKEQTTEVPVSGSAELTVVAGSASASASTTPSGTYVVDASGQVASGTTPDVSQLCQYLWNGSAWTLGSMGSCSSCPPPETAIKEGTQGVEGQKVYGQCG